MRVAAIVVAWVVVLGAPALADSVDDARRRTLTSDYQAELPGYEAEAGSGGSAATPQRLRRTGDPHQPSLDTRGRRAEETGPVAPLMSFLLWGVVIVVALLAAFWFASELMKGEDRADLGPDDAAPPTDAETVAIIDRPLGDADELAARGEFAEAIHTLLLRTLQELARSAAVRVERSHTSREILARVPVLADAREALAGLITAVELTHFGDEPANAADYDRCRRQFHVFAAAFRGPGARAVAA